MTEILAHTVFYRRVMRKRVVLCHPIIYQCFACFVRRLRDENISLRCLRRMTNYRLRARSRWTGPTIRQTPFLIGGKCRPKNIFLSPTAKSKSGATKRVKTIIWNICICRRISWNPARLGKSSWTKMLTKRKHFSTKRALK